MKLKLIKKIFISLTCLLSASLFSLLSLATSIDSPNQNLPEKNTIQSDKTVTYPAEFFDQYTPQNAMEMIQRLPGFSFDGGSNERGFGGNAGNVLIDGARPTSKSGGLRDALQRIPASQVLTIEILRGGVSAGEAAGQAVVANVIKKEIATSGTWEIKGVHAAEGVTKPKVDASIAIKLGHWNTSFDTKVGAHPENRTAIIEDFNAQNSLTATTDEKREEVEEYWVLNGEGSRDLGGGKFTLNAALDTFQWQSDRVRATFSKNQVNTYLPDESRFLNEEDKNLNTELGIDWVKVANNWKYRVIALTSSHDSQYANTDVTLLTGSPVINESRYNKETSEMEHIIRMTYAKMSDSAFQPEFGFELANNSLESEQTLIENGTPETLEGADKVEELRGEFFINFVYNYTADLTLEGGITAELSEIKAYNAEVNSQSFQFFKPRLSANYTLNEVSSITFVAEHTVEQLDFNDFAASADSGDDRTTSGNANLQPEQATAFSAIYDWRYSERGSLNIEAVYELRQDVHEQIILPSGNQGLGNAGDADFWYVKVNASIPIDALLDHGLLEIDYTYKDSKFYDPIINDYRTIYNYKPNSLIVDFRQDILQLDFSWGMQFQKAFKKTQYFIDEIKTNAGENHLTTIFIETTHFLDIKSRLEVRDAKTANFTLSRYFYQDDRSGAYQGAEITHLKRDTEIVLSFSGTF